MSGNNREVTGTGGRNLGAAGLAEDRVLKFGEKTFLDHSDAEN